ncbi:TPM domain-containing protein [Aureibaculum algae]|uniref:TPM domain-containing protein n=1 Tax=Aureibaculum algae TaxID=2584122 RepID=A0A5B7TZF6_9FLAO|nr:TPM domain-containing protein [Aureibaculum algae]QCX40576.1 TPM domain-containing protein [Aureibaculum algae]
MDKTRFKYFHFIIIAFLLFGFSIQSFSQDIPEKKHPDKAVQDYVNLLSDNEQRQLNLKLKNYADTTSTGIAIAIRDDIVDDINFYGAQMLAAWGLGQAKEDNGVLIVLDTNQRKVAISTGYGVEHLLTDALSKRIIETIITPQFKQGNYYEGLDRATSAIMQILNGEYKGTPQGDGGGGIPVVFIIIFVIVLLIILSGRNKRNGGNGGNKRNGATQSILEAIILSRAGRGGFGGGGFGGGFGGGSSGGGFGGFGGGMGGGGGASGSW